MVDSESPVTQDEQTRESQKRLQQEKQSTDTVESIEALVSDGYDIVKGGREYVSFRPNNDLAPNKNVVERYLEGYDQLVLLYNKEENILVLKPINDYAPDVGKVVELNPGDNNTLVIHLSGWMRQYDIHYDAEQTHRYDVEWDKEKQALFVDLDQDPEVKSQTRSEPSSE